MCYNTQSSKSNENQQITWPLPNKHIVSELVLGLSQALRVTEAIAIIKKIKNIGLPQSQDISFGRIVNCPMAPYTPLAVVQPLEGIKIVDCPSTCYTFELCSGNVESIQSEIIPSNSANDAILSVFKYLKIFDRPVAKMVHDILIRTPDEINRKFRVATVDAEVPAQQNDRITVICAPTRPNHQNPVLRNIMNSNPPKTVPGQAMSLFNHNTGNATLLLKAPNMSISSINKTEIVPNWVFSLTALLIVSDSLTALIDPKMPVIAAFGLGSVFATAFATNQLILPNLKKIPKRSLQMEQIRQDLFIQHKQLLDKINKLISEASEDIGKLAKLWQLESKMTSIGTNDKYIMRIKVNW